MWPVRQSFARKLFGLRRRSRALRHTLEAYAGEAARSQATARRPQDAAHHAGRRAAYLQALAEMAGASAALREEPPNEIDLARAWRRGHAAAADHARRLMEEMR